MNWVEKTDGDTFKFIEYLLGVSVVPYLFRNNISRIVSFGIALAVLHACGGGGSGETNYTGNTNPAVVTVNNAAILVANVIDNAVSSDAITASRENLSASFELGDQILAANQLRLYLNETLTRTVAARPAGYNPSARIDVDETDPCDSGSIHTTGALNDDGTGTVTARFNSCRLGNETLNGKTAIRIDAFDLESIVITDATIIISALTLTSSNRNISISGTIRLQVTLATNTERLTANTVTRNRTGGGRMKTENLVIVDVYDNLMFPGYFHQTIDGRVYDSVLGYVDISTLIPFSFSTMHQLFADGGQVLLEGEPIGAGNRSILLSALSPTMAWLELDLDGDGVREIAAFSKWLGLFSQEGADLADSDGDGMHNSWEAANGLDPDSAADVARDNDSDGFDNLREYRGGGDPNSAAVAPNLGKVLLNVATGISTADSNESNPGKAGLAYDGSKFLLVSCRELGPSPGIFGVFVRGATAGPAIPIASGDCRSLGGTSENSISLPGVAFDGTNYLVVYVKGAIIRGIRVSPSGNVLDGPNGFPISTGILFNISNWAPSIAFDGSNYLVVWDKYNGLDHDIYGARVTPGGQAGAEFPISTATGNQDSPDLAFDGVNFLVVWNDARSGNNDIYGARVTTDESVLEPSGIPIATTSNFEDAPQTDFDSMNFLVVWRSANNIGLSPANAEIRGTRISLDGSLLDGLPNSGGIPINTIVLGKSEPALAFDGINFLVSWVVGAFSNNLPAGMFGAMVSPSGQVVGGMPHTTGIPLSKSPPPSTRFRHPVISSGGTYVFLTWVNNLETSGSTKSIAGALIFP